MVCCPSAGSQSQPVFHSTYTFQTDGQCCRARQGPRIKSDQPPLASIISRISSIAESQSACPSICHYCCKEPTWTCVLLCCGGSKPFRLVSDCAMPSSGGLHAPARCRVHSARGGTLLPPLLIWSEEFRLSFFLPYCDLLYDCLAPRQTVCMSVHVQHYLYLCPGYKLVDYYERIVRRGTCCISSRVSTRHVDIKDGFINVKFVLCRCLRNVIGALKQMVVHYASCTVESC